MKNKKLAVVASGWHFPIAFFEQIAAQKIPKGWEVDMFIIAHRDPAHAAEQKKDELKALGYDRRSLYDRLLYRRVATVAEIEAQGWSLNPGRYVGVAPGQGHSDEEFREKVESLQEELESLHLEAARLQTLIAQNVAELLDT